MATANLVGVREVTLDDLRLIPAPPPDGRWRPVPHHAVVDGVIKALVDASYEIDQLKLGLARGDARLFGTCILNSWLATGVSLAVGFRSSYDKSISLQWAVGSRVFLCGNMAFHAEKIIARKHTTYGISRFEEAICKAVSELKEFREQEALRIRLLQSRDIDDRFAESFLLRAYQDEGLLSPRTLPIALKEWREPSFACFDQKNAWRLFNSITYAIAPRVQSNPQAHASATIRLGGMLSGALELPVDTPLALPLDEG